MQISRMPHESTRDQHHSWQVMINELYSSMRASERACMRVCHMSGNKQKKEERPQCKQEGNYSVGTLEQTCCSSTTQAWLLVGEQSAISLHKIFLSDLLLQYSLQNETLMLRAKGCQIAAS